MASLIAPMSARAVTLARIRGKIEADPHRPDIHPLRQLALHFESMTDLEYEGWILEYQEKGVIPK